MRNLRIKEITNGFMVSTKAYQETYCRDLNAVIDFMKRHFSKNYDDKPKRYYGEEKEE